jgi:hypothetical protein
MMALYQISSKLYNAIVQNDSNLSGSAFQFARFMSLYDGNAADAELDKTTGVASANECVYLST